MTDLTWLWEHLRQRQASQLWDLRLRWDDAYLIGIEGCNFIAMRRDDGRIIEATSAFWLSFKLEDDYSANPVPHAIRIAVHEGILSP